MFHAGCPFNKEIGAPLPSLSAAKISFGIVPEKAYIDIKTGEIIVDQRYADSLDDTALEALLYHELAHLQAGGCARFCDGKPKGCERCADNRLGACMALAGHSRETTLRAFDDLRVSRKTLTEDALAGYDFIGRQTSLTTTGKAPNPYQEPATTKAPTLAPAPISRGPISRDPIAGAINNKDAVTEKPGIVGDELPVVVVDAVDACNYNYGWVVGVAGGAFALAIIGTKWAVGK